MALSNQAKILIIVLIVSATFLYSKNRKDFYEQFNRVEAPLITTLPNVKFKDLKSGKNLSSLSILKEGSKGLFVHFWGTWCSPCEVELPEFINFARTLEKDGVQFLLIAVNDSEPNLSKFLKKFKQLPSNIVIGLDVDGDSLDYFGTSKVPETFLFDGSKTFITKFIGPQNWESSQFYIQTKTSLKI
jgi:cytochrome c biogenesis protein CcmG, thiol:disulfide interchange protein DsbE